MAVVRKIGVRIHGHHIGLTKTPLDGKQPFFNVGSPGKPPDFAPRRKNPVAGDEDGNGVFTDSPANGTGGFWAPDFFRQFFVCDCTSVGDVPESLPDLELKGCAPRHFNRYRERFQTTFEITVELPRRRSEKYRG